MKKRRNDGRLKVGSKVSFAFGRENVVATIVEDRGYTGWRGRRMWRVRLDWDEKYLEEPIELEMPEVELTRVAA